MLHRTHSSTRAALTGQPLALKRSASRRAAPMALIWESGFIARIIKAVSSLHGSLSGHPARPATSPPERRMQAAPRTPLVSAWHGRHHPASVNSLRRLPMFPQSRGCPCASRRFGALPPRAAAHEQQGWGLA